jgi:hypothetical protein
LPTSWASPSAPGNFGVTVHVTDPACAVASQSTNLSVTAAEGSGGPGATLLGIPVLAMVGVVAAAAVAVVLLVHRNRPPAEEAPPPAEPAYEDAPPSDYLP